MPEPRDDLLLVCAYLPVTSMATNHTSLIGWFTQTSQPGVTVAQIAHRYDLDARRISNWKTKFRSNALLPVEVMPDEDSVLMSTDRSPSCIEIDLPCGTRVRCHADANTDLVADIIAAVRSKR